MEPDVIRLYSSSPPPLDEGGEEEEEDEFGEFGSFGGVVSSISFSEVDTPITFNQSNALEDSPPDLYITFVQNSTLSEKGVWPKEKNLLKELKQPCVLSNQESLIKETEVQSFDDNDPAGIVMNGVASNDLQRELSIEHSVSSSDQHCFSISPDIKHSSTGKHIDNTCDGQINGYSESCTRIERDSESSISSGLNVKLSDFEYNEKQNQQIFNSHSCHEDLSEPEETQTRRKHCGDSQSFYSCEGGKDTQKEDKGTQEKGIQDTPGPSSKENVVVYSNACFLEGSIDSEIAEVLMVHEVDMAHISQTQLSGDKSEMHESSGNMGMEVDVDDKTFNETLDEDFGDFRDAAQGFTECSRTESITQEGFADFVTAMSRCSTDDEFCDTDTLKDFQEEEELAKEEEESVDCAGDGVFCSELPPSDSFADFSSAPFDGLEVKEGENWATFGQQEAAEEGPVSWATFGKEQNPLQCQEKQDVLTSAPCSDNLKSCKRDRETAEFSCKIQNLLRNVFPLNVNSEVRQVTEVSPLQNVLQAQDQSDLSCSFSQGHDLAMWRHFQDIHGAHGLRFKWAGSHSNRILLNCLGIRNILFTGEKQQPLIVPMFAAGLGMLEPTKESEKSLASPAFLPSVPVESGNILCTQVVPSLTISVDGVDPELYELTSTKMEAKSPGHSITDAFTKLMESMEKTRTTARRPEQDEKISEEAAKVISLLPDLSFMQARVLMFPSILTPATNHI
ncbi:uncharacterized protein aftphb [Misgurnus anguillicaudatus]|uniref:uncharacterized protein aftphb n=1 Tax=Misgurnus anguillicaudatus TaxID=75329 RepID=UPI003CCF47BE